jgi:uncharacterized protein
MALRRFHGRMAELDALRRSFAAEASALWVVYGRRRVGKTALLEEFCRDKAAFFFTAGVESSRAQVRRFIDELASHTNQPLLKQLRPSSWSDALQVLHQHLDGLEQKAVVVFDEFQWMCRGTSSVLSDLQRLWDRHWKHGGRVQLILCGSAVSFMVGEVLAQKSPLFGRRTGTIHLQPLDAREASPFFGRRSLIEHAEALICLGGVPAYLEQFATRSSRSVRQVLDELAFQPGGYLVDEIDFVFSEQLDRTERYREIVSLISVCPRTVSDLGRELGLNRGQVAFYMQRLQLLGLVDKHRPITMAARSKTVRYRLRDEYLRFYFHFIEPNLARIASSQRRYHFDRVTRDSWDTFLGLGFEHLVSNNLPAVMDKIGASQVLARVGSYWHHRTRKREGLQIDLVVEREDNVSNLIECKWSRVPVGVEIVADLERKARLYPNPRRHTLEPVLVTASGATRKVHDAGIPVVTLKDLFDA